MAHREQFHRVKELICQYVVLCFGEILGSTARKPGYRIRDDYFGETPDDRRVRIDSLLDIFHIGREAQPFVILGKGEGTAHGFAQQEGKKKQLPLKQDQEII